MTAEQATALSDVPLALLAGGLAWHLARRPGPTALARLLTVFLAAAAASAALGGAWHAVRDLIPPVAATTGWKLTLIAIGVADAALLAAYATATALDSRRRLVAAFIVTKLGVYLAFALTRDSFLPAVLDQLGALVAGVLILAWDRMRDASLPAPPLLAGAVLAIGSGLVQAAGIDVAGWLNHNVLYHLVAMLALVAFWRAGASGSTNRPAPRSL